MDLKELAGRFDALAANLGGAFAKAFEALGEEMIAEAKGLAPARTGRLRGSVGAEWSESKNAFRFFTRKAPYAWAVERGKDLAAKNSAYLTFNAGGGVRKVKSARHPARPFMTPVFNGRFYPEGEKNLERFIRVLLREAENGLS
jgi:hypothetical protein